MRTSVSEAALCSGSGNRPSELRDTKDTATRLQLSHRTLERWRMTGEGPPFRKLGGRVLYAVDDVDEWLDGTARRSTSETAAA